MPKILMFVTGQVSSDGYPEHGKPPVQHANGKRAGKQGRAKPISRYAKINPQKTCLTHSPQRRVMVRSRREKGMGMQEKPDFISLSSQADFKSCSITVHPANEYLRVWRRWRASSNMHFLRPMRFMWNHLCFLRIVQLPSNKNGTLPCPFLFFNYPGTRLPEKPHFDRRNITLPACPPSAQSFLMRFNCPLLTHEYRRALFKK